MSKRKTKKKSELKSFIENKISGLNKTEKILYTDSLYGTDSATTAIKNRFNSTFIIPFALALNAPPAFIALISSVPLLVGSFFQLFVADLMKIVRRRKEIIVFTSLLDAMLWIPILLIPFLWNNNYVLLLNIIILQSIALSLLRPFYNSLIGDIMPIYKRGKILGNMNMISSGAAFFGNLLFGFILSLFENINIFMGFAIIFFIQAILRTFAATVRARYTDKPLDLGNKMQSLLNFGKNLRKTNFGKFVLFSSLIQFALGVSRPFFAPYMLEYLGWNMMTFTLITSASIVSSLVVLKAWGQHIDKRGSRWMLSISGLLIPFFPLLWIFFKEPVYFLFFQFITGAVWAAYDLSTATFIMDATDRKSRIILNAYYHFFLGVFIFAGSMLGGLIMQFIPKDFFINSYHLVFGLSVVIRVCISFYFIPKLRDERFINIKFKGKEDEIFIMPHRGFFEIDSKKRK